MFWITYWYNFSFSIFISLEMILIHEIILTCWAINWYAWLGLQDLTQGRVRFKITLFLKFLLFLAGSLRSNGLDRFHRFLWCCVNISELEPIGGHTQDLESRSLAIKNVIYRLNFVESLCLILIWKTIFGKQIYFHLIWYKIIFDWIIDIAYFDIFIIWSCFVKGNNIWAMIIMTTYTLIHHFLHWLSCWMSIDCYILVHHSILIICSNC